MKNMLTAGAVTLILLGGNAFADNHGDKEKGEQCHKKHKAQMEEALSSLPKDKAELVRTTFKSMKEGRKEGKEAMKAHYDDVRNILMAEPFDRSAFMAKHAEIDTLHDARHMKKHTAIADLAEQLNAGERAILVEAMPKPGKWRKCKGKHHGGNADDKSSEE